MATFALAATIVPVLVVRGGADGDWQDATGIRFGTTKLLFLFVIEIDINAVSSRRTLSRCLDFAVAK